ncbi:WhiB family transcriptional regulator [Microbacterium esteraromaticum]|uniref:WhiB family transcriptional regulator n=1 Tax=Microbacterium esteraromaticum TaxID=57043 RepID=UPI00195BDDEB|nr:WhiB family transcriptional regulator [Microbacterium esteraromaticum]MBM7464632.1 hypothetical protein [Microbacterium esteraromaticum]
MEWRTDESGQRFRVVEESVLLKWWRERMLSSPVHQARLRRAAIARGETPPPIPKRAPERAQGAIQPASGASQVSDDADPAEATSDAFLRVLAELPVFHGQREHAALMRAMQDEPPACDGLEVFTADRFDDPEQTVMMRGICRACPLLDLCAAFAAAGKPTAGMWAGMTPTQIRQDERQVGGARLSR